jgi:hypothetical protein
MSLLRALCLALALFGASAAAWPDDFTVVYELRLQGASVAEVKRKFQRNEDGGYRFESITRPGGWLALALDDQVLESSEGQILADSGVRPLHYLFRHIGQGDGRVEELHFDWPARTIRSLVRDKRRIIAIEDHVQDKLGYQLALMWDLQRGRKDIRYRVADRGKLKTYDVEILGEETLTTPLGRLKTIKLRRQRESRNTELWCAPELGYLAVRGTHEEKSGFDYELHLLSLTGSPAAALGAASGSGQERGNLPPAATPEGVPRVPQP